MERYRKAAVFTLIVFFILCTLIMLSEIPMIPEAQRTLYIWTKFSLIVWALPMAYWLYKDITNQLANTLVGVFFMAYVVQGQCFRPLYYFAFAQLGMIYSFLFPVSKARFRVIISVGGIALLGVLYYHWADYVEYSRNPKFSDLLFSVIDIWVISYIANTFFASERDFREDALKRFGHIGIQTARIVHDLKGLIAAPKLYVQMLQAKFGEKEDAEAAEVLSSLSRDLEGFSRVLFELNQLSGFKAQELTDVAVSDVVESLKVLLKKQLAGVQVESSAQMVIQVDKTLFSSMLMNLFLNSVDAFRASGVKHPKIEILSTPDRILVTDNGGGFQKDILDSLKQGKFKSTRQGGSALGLFFVFDGMSKMGGKVRAYNMNDGACVELIFPKRQIRGRIGEVAGG